MGRTERNGEFNKWDRRKTMKDSSLVKKIRDVEDEHAEEIGAARLADHGDDAKMRAMFVLGGVAIANKVATSLNSEAIKALITFQEQKMHEALGFDRFVEFLDQSEYSPLTKAQFYERKAILEKEGDALFDLLTELGMSIRKRKLLGKGNIELVGDKLIVHDGDEVTEISISDRSTILAAITSLADANAEKSIKLDRQKEKIDKYDGKVRELYDEIDQVKASKAAEIGQDPHSLALAQLCFAFAALREAAAELPLIDRAGRRDNVLEIIANQSRLTNGSYRTDGTEKPVEPIIEGDTFDESLESFLDQVDLTGGDNEAELAAKM